MYNEGSDPMLINCTFSNNSSFESPGGPMTEGGEMANSVSSPTLIKRYLVSDRGRWNQSQADIRKCFSLVCRCLVYT